jgi:alpha-L-arabinofuranosidase
MNYSEILDELNKASLFELYRLNQAISHSLEDPVRIKNIKDSLKVGQNIEYFHAQENRLIEASITKLNRTRLLVKNRHDGKLWDIPYYHINLDQANIAISGSTGKLDRNRLKVGDKVAFKDRKGNELFGEVVKLNQKTAGVLVGTARWKVGYSLLSLIIEGESGSAMNLIEGQLLSASLEGPKV